MKILGHTPDGEIIVQITEAELETFKGTDDIPHFRTTQLFKFLVRSKISERMVNVLGRAYHSGLLTSSESLWNIPSMKVNPRSGNIHGDPSDFVFLRNVGEKGWAEVKSILIGNNIPKPHDWEPYDLSKRGVYKIVEEDSIHAQVIKLFKSNDGQVNWLDMPGEFGLHVSKLCESGEIISSVETETYFYPNINQVE